MWFGWLLINEIYQFMAIFQEEEAMLTLIGAQNKATFWQE